LGATFYHAFSGFPPFEGKTAEDVLHKHLKADPIPLNKRNTMIPNALSMIIERMMNKEPEKRYQNYGGIINDLESLSTGNTRFHEKQIPDNTLGSMVKKRFSFFRN
jgi:serine/threonine protein kinase